MAHTLLDLAQIDSAILQALDALANASGALTNNGAGVLSWAAGGGSLPVADTTAVVMGSADATKLLRFDVDGFTAGATRVLTPPNADITLAGQNYANVFTVGQMIDSAADAIDLRVQGHSTKTTNYQTWETSAGTVLLSVDSKGFFSRGASRWIHSYQPTGVSGYNLFFGIDAGNYSMSAVETWECSYNLGFGGGALISLTRGYKNTVMGANGGRELTTGYENTFVGVSAGGLQTSGRGNIRLGAYAGYQQTTASYLLIVDSVFRASAAVEATNAILYGAMASTPASQTLRINAVTSIYGGLVGNEDGGTVEDFRWETDSYDGIFLDASNNSVVIMSNAAGKVGFYGATAVIQPAGATQAAPAAYVTGAFGLDSDANMHALYDLVVAMRTALVNTGIMKGAA